MNNVLGFQSSLMKIGAFALALSVCAADLAPSGADSMSPVADSVIAKSGSAGIALLSHLAKSESSNTFLSPVSIDEAMVLVSAGTEGETKREITASFGASGFTGTQAGDQVTALNRSLANADPLVHVDITNALWSDTEWPLSSPYVALCNGSFHARAQTLDFSAPSSADTINQWVSSKTHGKIDTIVLAGDMPHPGAVITNAVYFHGIWSNSFDPTSTTDGTFTISPGSTATLPMMYRSGEYPYAQDDQAQSIALPYGKSGRIEMLILLPRAGISVAELMTSMTAGAIEQTRSSMMERQVQLTMPRFHVAYAVGLIPAMEDMGIRQPFSASSDFKPMGFPRGYISAIIHKTTLDVDEQGTVATAATGIVMRSMAIAAPQNIVRVDHPFICIIRDSQTKALIFVGVINKPEPLKN